MTDPFDLERFVTAQNPLYSQVLSELRRGVKTGHWMWFIFPQLKGLGSSWAANHFGISSAEEAHAYLQHPILGERLIECTTILNQLADRSALEIFGEIDSLKLRSSMTLFAEVEQNNEIFKETLEKYFSGELDPMTRDKLQAPSRPG